MRTLPPFLTLFVLAALTFAPIVRAAEADPGAARIDAFDHALIDTMKEGPSLGAMGRYRKLAPAVEETFNLPVMTQFAVGPAWAGMSQADHQALIKAFTRLSIASYAHNFDRFGGERFTIDPKVETRGPDKIVQAHLITTGKTVNLIYRMRQSAGGWKIVDVYYDAISQLTTRRSDFAAPLASGGAKGLIAHLTTTSDKLLQ
ncbi:MAG: ABC transporter substrate-binding protein [Pseudomonadota bacterium]|nr:ABC transporter substrate-binding protein [Pseudomonadota bacterium]